jgi:hypothetical protein
MKESSDEASSSSLLVCGGGCGLGGTGIGFEVGMEGFRAGGGGFGGLGLGKIGRAKEGLGDLISGLEDLVIRGVGEGVRARTEDLFREGSGDGGGRTVVVVADLLRAGLFSVCGAAFCSNMPIKDVVGGIELVSRTCSSLPLELKLLTEPGDRPGERLVKLDCFLRAAIDNCCCPV